MPHPWFLIRCPACGYFWGERGRFPPHDRLVTPCPLCKQNTSIEFVIAADGLLAIRSVIDVSTNRHGDWSPLLDTRIHWRGVN